MRGFEVGNSFLFGSELGMSSEVKIKLIDMSDEMKEDAVHTAVKAIAESATERDIAKSLKEYFDIKYEAAWHCIVGKAFGSFVTHETKCFIFFTVSGYTILLWKNGFSSAK